TLSQAIDSTARPVAGSLGCARISRRTASGTMTSSAPILRRSRQPDLPSRMRGEVLTTLRTPAPQLLFEFLDSGLASGNASFEKGLEESRPLDSREFGRPSLRDPSLTIPPNRRCQPHLACKLIGIVFQGRAQLVRNLDRDRLHATSLSILTF